jgi:Zn-dependent M28 family amino/carboxypeptidase
MNFNGSNAFDNINEQLIMGPRTPESMPHNLFFDWLQSKLDNEIWVVEIQNGHFKDKDIRNIIAKNSSNPPQIIIAAHYDSRLIADNDPDPTKRINPVPGANDGASGVAVLIELSRTIPIDSLSIWLVFFDAEDNGNLPGWEWIMGSRYFVTQLDEKPQAVIILDMVGDKDLNIYRELNSNKELTDEIWNGAKKLGYEGFFINTTKHSLMDDHIPFVEAGIPAVLIIDFDYPFWHTTADTIDKISADSLSIVGSTILYWVNSKNELQKH